MIEPFLKLSHDDNIKNHDFDEFSYKNGSSQKSVLLGENYRQRT